MKDLFELPMSLVTCMFQDSGSSETWAALVIETEFASRNLSNLLK